MQRYRKQIHGFHPDAITALKTYAWPGNVRELRHVMERAVLLTRSDMIQVSDLGIRGTPCQSAATRRNESRSGRTLSDQPCACSAQRKRPARCQRPWSQPKRLLPSFAEIRHQRAVGEAYRRLRSASHQRPAILQRRLRARFAHLVR